MKILKKLFAPKEIRVALGILDELNYQYDSRAFEIIREDFEKIVLSDTNEAKEKLVKFGSIRICVLNVVGNIAYNHLSSGKYHCYRGMLMDGPADDLLRIFNN